jgi:hypothetical protein
MGRIRERPVSGLMIRDNLLFIPQSMRIHTDILRSDFIY